MDWIVRIVVVDVLILWKGKWNYHFYKKKKEKKRKDEQKRKGLLQNLARVIGQETTRRSENLSREEKRKSNSRSSDEWNESSLDEGNESSLGRKIGYYNISFVNH